MEASTKRSTQLIANFVNGFADGWFMKVPECFKRELDIQLTPRVNPDIWGIYLIPAKKALSELSSQIADSALLLIKEIEDQSDRIVVWGNKKSLEPFDKLVLQAVDLIKKTKNEAVKASIARKVSQIWTQGIRYCFAKDYIIHSNDNNYFIQILSASPTEIENGKVAALTHVKQGTVKFAIFNLTDGKTEKVGEHSLTQKDFVHFLKNGNNVVDQIPRPMDALVCQQTAFEW